MTPFLGALFLVIGFVFLINRLRLVSQAHEIIRVAGSALQLMGNPLLDDEAKERQMQTMAITLFKHFFIITFCGIATLLLPVTVIWGLDQLGLISLQATLEVSLSWPFLLGTCLLAIVIIIFIRKKQVKASVSFENRYLFIDQLLHRLSFASSSLQLSLAKFEDRWFRAELSQTPCKDPVFITALPRAGTTLLLELFVTQSDFASHSYRQMPFVLIPMIWNKFVNVFHTSQMTSERAHGDGMMIDLDSSEAFEEVIWMAFWRKHYDESRIYPWGFTHDEKSDSAFDVFFESHMRKIIAISHNKKSEFSTSRYISKNNLNIARLPYIKRHFPNARILVLFRSPLQHAASLHRQHLRFLEMHELDSFAQEYMAGIGHFDFGVNLRPIDFNGWFDSTQYQDAKQFEFWLEYWLATYSAIENESAETICLLDFDSLCHAPESTMMRIGEYVGVSDVEAFLAQQDRVYQPKLHQVDTSQVDPVLLQRADKLYKSLCKLSLI